MDFEKEIIEAEARSRLSALSDDTLLPEDLSAVYLNLTPKVMKTLRADGGGPQFFKPTGANAKAANQAASYTLGELRRWRSEKTYSSNLDLNVKTGIMKWTAAEPFFVAQECIVAKAGRDTEGWADLLADAIEGMISVETMEPCEAAARPWKSRAAHQSFADEYFAAMAFERERVCSAIEETALRVKLDGDGSHAILRSEDAAPPGIIL
jgi:hypothetical protein